MELLRVENRRINMFSRERDQFSAVFYRQYRKHVIRALTKMVVFVAVAGTTAIVCAVASFKKNADITLAGIATAIVLFLVWSTWRNGRDLLRVRVLPYFERPLGQKRTWMAGEDFLRHSRQLDGMAAKLGVRPLSEFASGDDLIQGETLQWFSPEEALKTLERLLQPDARASLAPAVISDLAHIQAALCSACSKSIKFCFLIREGTSASGLELDRRKGSFF